MTIATPYPAAEGLGSEGTIERIWLAGLFVFALLLRLSSFTGIIASDDLGYVRFAREISDGTYTPFLHHYALRYGLTVPVGIVYALFGVNEWSSVVLPLLGSALSVVLIALIGARLFGKYAGLLAALLYASFPLQLHYSTILVPEPLAECYVLTAVLLHVRIGTRHFLRGLMAGVLVGIAYLTKEPALFIAPPLFLDAVFNKRWKHAAGLTAGVVLVLIAEVSYYYVSTGDLAFRQHAMAAHNANMLANPLEVIDDIPYRLLKAYPRMMLVPSVHFGIHSLLAIILAGLIIVPRVVRSSSARFLALWTIIPWLYVNFGSSSLTQYIVLPIAPRYIEFAYPPLFLGAAWFITTRVAQWPAAKRLVPMLMTLLVITGLGCGLATRGKGYNTPQVKALRAIAETSGPFGEQSCVHTEATELERDKWLQILTLLEGRVLVECKPNEFGVTLRAGAQSLPYVATPAPTPH